MGNRSNRDRLRAPGAALICLVALLGLAGCRAGQVIETLRGPALHLAASDRLLILAPHPDDEVLGCAGLIQEAVARHLPVRVVLFTYGDNNQWSFLLYRKHPVLTPRGVKQMGLVRHDEALAAARVLGLAPEQLTFLGYPDFGTLSIWNAHWGDRPPFQSMLTHVTAVPYPNALRPGAPYKGEDVVRDLTAIVREFRPTKVFVSHPADYMPDHRALYLFTLVALWDVAPEVTPDVYPYLVHFKRWPAPRGLRPTERLDPPLPLKLSATWRSYWLDPMARDRKRAAVRAHRSQYLYSARYLLSFVRPNELFGDVPIVPLGANAPLATLGSSPTERPSEVPEELTEVERAAFVGLETRSVQLEGDELVLSIEFSRPLGHAVEASVYVFGYRADRPFAQMPKLHIKVGPFEHTIYDQDRRLTDSRVEVSHHAKQLTVRVPLAALGDPRRVLFSARTSLGDVPLDWASWRIVELAPQ